MLGLALCSQVAVAQKLRFGLKGGFNLANVQLDETGNIDYKASLKTAFNGGIYTQITFLKDKIILQPELMYSAEGFKATDNSNTSSNNNETQTNLNFMNVPVTVIFKPLKFLNFQIGPEFGYLLKAKAEGQSARDAFKKSELGMNLGLGTTLFKVLDVNVRYNRGLTKMYDGDGEEFDGEADTQSNPDGSVNVFNNMFQVSMGLNLTNLFNKNKDK